MGEAAVITQQWLFSKYESVTSLRKTHLIQARWHSSVSVLAAMSCSGGGGSGWNDDGWRLDEICNAARYSRLPALRTSITS